MTRVIRLNAAEGFSFEVLKLELLDLPEDIFDVQLTTLEEGRSYRIELSLRGFAEADGTLRGRLRIVTDDVRTPERTVNIIAQFSREVSRAPGRN